MIESSNEEIDHINGIDEVQQMTQEYFIPLSITLSSY